MNGFLPQTLSRSPPRLGFLGVGWIGRHRMEAICAAGLCDVRVVADLAPQLASDAAALTPHAVAVQSLDELLAYDLDALVIATPSALHAEQAIRAFGQGMAVFCQKPLGRSAAEVAAVVEAAGRADRLLGLDLSYRHTQGMRAVRDLARSGELGRVFAADLVFHNAYGPNKAWFYNPAHSGGGCLMDLGVHLVDLALWVLDFPKVRSVDCHMFAQGRLISGGAEVEDYALATLVLETGAIVRIACSWRLPAGREAVIAATFYGDRSAAEFRNVDGSFYDFMAEHWQGVERRTLVAPAQEAWGGRAALAWIEELRGDGRFDPQAASQYLHVAETLDRLYGRRT